MYTDGVSEALDASGEFFETERLIAVMREHGSHSARTLCDQVFGAVAAHRGPVAQSDDVTMVAVQALRAGEAAEG